MKKAILSLALGCLSLTGLAQAQETSPPNTPTADPALLAQAAPAPAANPAPAAAPVPAPSPSATESRNIRFQFEGIPYTDVLERFAQMAGKPLLTDTNIVGTLTFHDANPYTFREALDTLNVMLAMKGLALVESGNFLRLVPFKELPAMPLRILRGSDATTHVRPDEMVTVVLDLKNLDSKETVEAVASMLSGVGSVAPLARGRGLILTDRLANIQRVRSLLAAIDTESAVDRQMKTFTLLHSSGPIIADLLNRTFGVATAPKRTSYNPNSKALEVLPPDPADYITAVYDEASRILVLFGPPDRIALAEELIGKFEQNGGPAGDVRIYYPQLVSADELASIIRQTVPGVAAAGEASSAAATKARIVADHAQNRLIVAAPIPGQLEQIEALINRVDKPVHGTGAPGGVPLRSQTVQLTRVFRPTTAEATNVTSILTQALTRRSLSGQILSTASISHDPATRSVVVSGSPSDVQIATDILAQLEAARGPAPDTQTRFFELASAREARDLQLLAEKLYRDQLGPAANHPQSEAKFVADPERHRLIVTAPSDQFPRIEALLRQLRSEPDPNATRQLHILPLQNARIESALPSIQQLVQEKLQDPRFRDLPKPSVLGDPLNHRLLITATAEQWTEIEKIVAAVDVSPVANARALRVFPLRLKPARELVPLLTNLLEQTSASAPPGSLTPKVMADPTGRQIIAIATPADFDRIEQLIQQFDTERSAAAVREFRAVELFSRSAAELTPLVLQLYNEQLRGQSEPPGGTASLLPETKNNRIMVSGAKEEIARVEAIIRQLDPEEQRGQKDETRVIRLTTALAADLAGLVEKSLNAHAQEIRILVDSRSNSLVVTGRSTAVEAAAQIIRQLDTRSESQPREMRILDLKQADANQVAALAGNLVNDLIKDQRGPDYQPQSRIIPDASGNRLIVSGPRDELATVAQVVAQLDQAPEATGGARVFKLVNADASKVIGVVSNAMLKFDARNQPIRRVSISLDRESNSIVVSGSRADLKDAEGILQRLDNEDLDPATPTNTSSRTRELKVIPVRGHDPEYLATLTLRVFAAQNAGRMVTNLVSVTAEPNSKRLLVLAPANVLPQVESVIQTLDTAPDEGNPELQAIDLPQANAAELLPRVAQIYAEQHKGKTAKPATLHADPSGARLMVHGAPSQNAAVRRIVETLLDTPRTERTTQSFDLGRLADAQRLLPVFRQLYRDRVLHDATLGPADAQMMSDGKTGRILVSARPQQTAVIESLFASLQLNASARIPRQTRTFDVGTAAETQRLLPLVQQLYADQSKDRPETDPADAQIIADPRSGRLIATGKPDHLDQIESLLRQLGASLGAGAPNTRSEIRETRVYDLSTASAVELATTVRLLYGEEAKSRFGLQNPDTLITPDAGSNRLIVAGLPAELAAVEAIIQKLDKVSAQSATARVFRLKSAEPDKVAEILGNALVRYDAYGRPQKRVAVSVDAKTRTLIVTGDPKELQGVSVIIEQLDQSLGAQPNRAMKVVPLTTGRVAALAPKLRELYEDQVRNQPELSVSDALILDDTASNQFLLAGTDAQLRLIERILQELQAAQAALPARETRMFDVGSNEELTRLQPIIQQLYTSQWRDRSPRDPADAQLVPDTKNARFVVTGRPDHLAAIERILAELTAPAAAAAPRETRVYDLNTTAAAELAGTVRSLYQDQFKARPIPAGGAARILPDQAANRLIVSGNTNELAVVEQLIQRLDQTNPRTSQARVFTLKKAAAAQVARVLSTSLVQIQPNGLRLPRVSVGPDTNSNLVVVSGEPKDLQAAAVIVEQMDAVASPRPRQLRLIPLRGGLAEALAPRVRQLYEDRLRGTPGAGAPDALILGDDISRRLILAASDEHLPLLESIVQQLEATAPASGRQSRILTLERQSARAVATMIRQLFARQVNHADPSQQLIVTTTGDEQTLVLDADAATLDQVQQLVQQLEQTHSSDHEVIQTVHLKKGLATELAEAVTRTLSGRSSQPQRIQVTPVAGANSLLIRGSTNAVSEVMKVVRELDQESSGGEIEVRVYRLENGNVREIEGVINQLLDGVTRSLRRLAGSTRPSATVTVDERARHLIIAGTPAHFRVVEKILPTLDKAPERSDRDVQFVWLRKAKAIDVASKLEAVFSDRPSSDRPIIEADAFNNSLTLIARRGDVAQLQDLIARLDDSVKDSAIQVRLRTLDRITAEQMARLLQNIYPQLAPTRLRVVDKLPQPAPAPAPNPAAAPGANPSVPAPAAPAPGDAPAAPEVVIAIDREANALILSGPAQELDHIDRMISDLTMTFHSSEAEFRLFALQEADPIAAARTLTDLLKPDPIAAPTQPGQSPRLITPMARITVVPEARTRSLIVRARPTDFDLVESIVKQIDARGIGSQIEFRLVPLTNALPAKVLPLVQQMVTQLNQSRPGEPLTVSLDPRAQGLMVIARDSVLNQIEGMIRQLDTPMPFPQAEILVLNLKKARAPQLAAILRNMLRPGTTGETTAEARELQEQVRRLQVRDDQGKTVLLDLRQPIKISSDPASGEGGGNRLILTSTADNLKSLAAIVAMMDTVPVLEDVVVTLRTLRHADAASISEMLNTVFTQGRQLNVGPNGPGAEPEGALGRALIQPLHIAVEPRSNTLVLSARSETMNLALRLINDLDQPHERSVTEVKLFRLKHASAVRLVPLLRSVFAEGPPVPGTEGLSRHATRLRSLAEPASPKTTETAASRPALLIQAEELSNTLIVAARADTVPILQEIIEQLDIPAASGLETVRIYPLQHADPASVLRILNDLYTSSRSSSTVRQEDIPILSVDLRSSALVVAGNAKSFGIIDGLLRQLDQKLAFPLRDVRIIPLANADATAVAATLQQLMDARVTQRATLDQGQSDSLKVTLMADPRSNSLLVAGSAATFETVEALAKQIDAAPPALSGRIRLIPLQFADARVIATTLTTLFTERSAASRVPAAQRIRPTLLPEPRSNSLIVTATPEDNALIDELLPKLDTKPNHPSVTVTVLALKHHDAARVASLLTAIFTARLKAQTPPGQTPLPSEQVEVQPDPINNAIIVAANRENLEAVQALLPQIDAEPSVAGGVLEAIPLQFADAQRVASLLRSLVEQGLYRPGTPAGGANRNLGRDALAVSVDTRSNTLLVSASPANLAVVKTLIERLDTRDFNAATNVRLYPLKKARASSLATTLEQFFRAKRAGDATGLNANERSTPVGILADDRINALLVTGGKDAFDVIDNVLPQLDGESVFARMNFRVFPLKRATARKLQTTLQQVVANRPPRAVGEPVDPITIVADQWINALLVGASVEDMGTVESLIERLDSEPAETGMTIHVFPLSKGDARRVAQTIQGLFREGAAATSAAANATSPLPVTISADERINAIVVSCGETDAKRIGELVKKLDTEQVARVSEIKVFPLKFARAEALSAILNTALNTKPTPLSEQSPNAQSLLQFITRSEEGQELITAALKEAVLITPDPRMNSLIVSGPVDYMNLIDQIISRLDSSAPQLAQIKVFALRNADAAQMAQLLMQMFHMTPTTGGGGAQRSIQYTLMRPREATDGAEGDDIAVASATLGTAEQNALTVTVDPRTNSLLVGGTDHYVRLVSEIIDSLDASPANERRTEVIHLKNSHAIDVAGAIRTFLDQERMRVTQVLGTEAIGTAQRMLEREVAVVGETNSNTLLVSANPRYFTQIREIIDELDKPQSQVLIQVLLAEVTLDALTDLGVEWSHNGRKGDVSYAVGTDFNVKQQLTQFGGFSSALSGSDFSFLLRALKNEGRLEVLSRPQIVTGDNKPATINIGQRIPLITDSRVTPQGDTINSFRYEDVGVNLTVTPKISPDGFVRMEIGTTNSALSSSTVEINKSATVPIINQRRANTTVSVQSGQTIVIGGLIDTTDDRRVKKMPLLGSIPYLGALFRSTQQTKDRKELLILLTPQVLENSSEPGLRLPATEVTRDQLDSSSIRKEINRDEIQRRILDPLFPDLERSRATESRDATSPSTNKK